MNTSNTSNVGTSCHTSWNTTFSNQQQNILRIYLYTPAVTNAVSNFIAIIALIKTKQLVNLAMKTIFLVSVVDFLAGAVVEPATIVILTPGYHNEDIGCSTFIAVEMLMWLFVRLSFYLVCLLSFDRYTRLKYMHHYPFVITAHRSLIAIITTVATAVINTLIRGIAVVYGKQQS